MFEIDDPEIDVEELEERVREAIEAKRGVRFTDEELEEIRRMPLRPRQRREDLPTRLLEEIPETRSKLPRVPTPPGGGPPGKIEPEELFIVGPHDLKGRLVGFVRRITWPIFKALTILPALLHHVVHRDNQLKARIDRQGEWAERQLSQMTGQIERWRERDLQLLHNLVYESSDLVNRIRGVEDRLDELSRRLRALEERQRTLEEMTAGSALDEIEVED